MDHYQRIIQEASDSQQGAEDTPRRIYQVGLIDDLHNFFPDLLYGDRLVSSEFQYIRDRTQQLFPSQYARGDLEYRVSVSMLNNILHIIQPIPLTTRWRNLLAYTLHIDDIDNTIMEPVVVRPTQEQIDTATSITPYTEVEASHICTICQDHGSAEETPEWREIESCGHLYHKKCIDRWFETSVHCPICRIDIRD